MPGLAFLVTSLKGTFVFAEACWAETGFPQQELGKPRCRRIPQDLLPAFRLQNHNPCALLPSP